MADKTLDPQCITTSNYNQSYQEPAIDRQWSRTCLHVQLSIKSRSDGDSRRDGNYLPTTAIVLDMWNKLRWKSGVLLIFALGVLRISVSRIHCTY